MVQKNLSQEWFDNDKEEKVRGVDVIAVGAHPDDIELWCGGTIACLVNKGYKVGLVDLSLGELGTRGNKDTRRMEAQRAAEVLGVSFRTNLCFPDGEIKPTSENRNELLKIIRAYKPDWIFSHSQSGHPDHWNAEVLVREAVHHSGLAKLETESPRHRPQVIASWLQFDSPRVPEIVFDISESWAIKEEAIRCYVSQLYNPQSVDPKTILTDVNFVDRIRSHNRFMGSLSNCRYGEGFLLSRIPRVTDLNF